MFLDKILVNFSKETTPTFFIRLIGVLFGVLLSIFTSNLIGASGLGTINLCTQIVSLLITLSLFGFPTVILKEISIAFNKNNFGHINSVIRTSLFINISFGVIVTVMTLFFIPFIVTDVFKKPELAAPLSICVGVLLFKVFSSIMRAGLNGVSKIWQSSFFDQLLNFSIVFIIILFQYFLNYKITVISFVWAYAFASIISACSIVLYWWSLDLSFKKSKLIPKQMFRVALPLIFVQGISVVSQSIDSLMIGSMLDVESVGIYSVSFRIALISSFLLMVTNSVLAPKVASMFANNKLQEMEVLIQTITKLLCYISLFVLAVLVIFGKSILSIWGIEFVQGYWPMVILSLGQFVSISIGCVGLILTLCNEEKIFGRLVFYSAILNIILNFIFINLWGVIGAAIATAGNLIFLNVGALYLVRNRININPFGKLYYER